MRGISLDHAARGLIRGRSLQNVDTWARRAGRVLPPLADYREMRAVAVTGSVAGLQTFAALALRGRATPAKLWSALDLYIDGDFATSSATLRHLHPRRTQHLAWLALQLHTSDQHLKRAVALLTWLTEQGGERALTATSRGVLAESLMLLGDMPQARTVVQSGKIDAVLHARIMTDLASPYLTDATDRDAWLTRFNEPYTHAGFAPVAVDSTAPTAFQGVEATAEPVDCDALVTIVISSFRPGELLLHAVRSVLRSSWGDLEVLVVDDSSGPEYQALYARVAALDPRVRVHTMDSNGGTYRIRNWALEHARGQFITFHDSDDWMHPDRIATQMAYLREHPLAPACLTSSVRVTPSMALVNSRSLGTKQCEPSILFERVPTAQLMGGFDDVRRGADAEFRQRLAGATGVPVPVVSEAPLTLQLILADSLSDADIRRYLVALPRRIYRASYEQWHAQCVAQGLSLRLDVASDSPRPFYAPPRVSGEATKSSVDVVLEADFLDTRRESAARAALVKAREAVSRGASVGMRHLDGPWHRHRTSVNVPSALISMLNDREVVMLESPTPAQNPGLT